MRIWLTTILILFWFGAKAPNRNIEFEKLEKEQSIKFHKEFEMQRFLDFVFLKEGSKNWDTINQIGAMGGFQFMPSTLKWLGYDLTPYQFKKNPWLFPKEYQIAFMKILLKKNERSLYTIINKYQNKEHRGVLITKAGILMAAHLSGSKNVKKWFNGGKNKQDINKTSIEDYLKLFSEYDI